MRAILLVSGLFLTGLTSLPAAAQSGTRVQAGTLTCAVAPAIGFVVGSVRDMSCTFKSNTPKSHAHTAYRGRVTRFGLDLGVTGAGTLGWAVFAPVKALKPGELAGHYSGVSAEVALGVGGGTNVLVGGSNQAIVLQPLSVHGATGVAIAAGISDLTLTPGH